MTERRQKGRCGAVPYEVYAIFGRPMIAPTNNICPVFWNSMHCPLDEYPEWAFFNVGTIDDVIEKAKNGNH